MRLNLHMKNLAVLTTVISFFLISVLFPQSASSRFLRVESKISIEAEKSYFERVGLDEEISTNLIINYTYGRFAIPSGYFFLSPSPTKINLRIVEKPQWCDVILEKENLAAEMPLSSVFGGNVVLEVEIKFKIVDSSAPGYEKGKIIIEAEALDNGNIKGSENRCEIILIPDFYQNVDVDRTYFFLKLSPGESRDIYVNVTNKCNMDITVEIKPKEEHPDLISIYSMPISIGAGETKSVKLSVDVKKYGREINEKYNIPLVLSYHAKGHDDLKGEDIDLQLYLNIKSKPKSILFGLETVLIFILVIIILILLFVMLKRKESFSINR